MKINRTKVMLELARKEWSQLLLAEKSQISSSMITKMLAGNNVSPITLGRIARALEVDPSVIIENVELIDQPTDSNSSSTTPTELVADSNFGRIEKE